MYKLIFYVPTACVEEVKQACFEAGAGKYKNYDRCSWQTLGKGQFRPLADSQPFIGQKENDEIVEEFIVEMIVQKHKVKQVVAALLQIHPYEEVAYHLTKVLLLKDLND